MACMAHACTALTVASACMRMHLDAYGMPYRKNVVDCAYMCAIDR